MEHHTSEELTKNMRWGIAERLAKDRLDAINEYLEEVKLPNTFYVKYGKRIIDIPLSLFAGLASLPINLVIGIITLFDVGRPLFYKQVRAGKNGVPFTIIKFRNMRIAYDERGEMLKPAQRVTKWGRFVRKTSLDELLNFWNVLKGDMSIIGPRPLPPEYTIRYNKRHKARLLVRPGLECPPWTPIVHTRTWQEQLDNDVWYVENISLKTDLIMCLRLVQYALDKNNSLSRSRADNKTFAGYSEDGRAISFDELPQEYVDWAFSRMHSMNEKNDKEISFVN